MASYIVYLRERRPGKDRKNAREALSLLRSAGVHFNVEREPIAVNLAASRTGWSVHTLRLPQIFHGEKHVGGVGPLKKYLATQGPTEKKAVADFRREEGMKVIVKRELRLKSAVQRQPRESVIMHFNVRNMPKQLAVQRYA